MRSLALFYFGVGLSFAWPCAGQAVVAPEPTTQPDVSKPPQPGRPHVVVIENIKLDYAQVLSVEPVYQTLRATRTEQQCTPVKPAQQMMVPPAEEGRLARMVDTVKSLFGNHPPSNLATAPLPLTHCRIVEVPREFRRPISYDVDYVYKGTKYRSRLPEDPGNRLRIRVSVTPYIPDAIVETVH